MREKFRGRYSTFQGIYPMLALSWMDGFFTPFRRFGVPEISMGGGDNAHILARVRLRAARIIPAIAGAVLPELTKSCRQFHRERSSLCALARTGRYAAHPRQ
jgi:hypothetical protein